jgi:gamma-glutamyltranspeptidase/glutathione hydrolase
MSSSTGEPYWIPHAHRGAVVAPNGVVAASQPLAASAGLDVLRAGGTCADAAIAVSATLAVTEPYNSHLGGDAFVIHWDNRAKRATAYNGSGRSPTSLVVADYADGIPLRGIRAATVPGLVDCWFALHERHGTLPVRRLLGAALEYAAEGFPAGTRYASVFAAHAAQASPWFGQVLRALTGMDRVPRQAETVRQPDLAWTLSQIADGGRDAFYVGPIAGRLLTASRDAGGDFEAPDFAGHRTTVTDPLNTTYRGTTIHVQPPVSQGVILAEMLNIIEGYDTGALGFGSPDAVHVMVEAKKLAFADRLAWLGDTDAAPSVAAVLASKAYAEARRSRIGPNASGEVEHGPEPGRDTTYFCVADRHGNAVSFIQSVYHAFGCGVVAPGTGVLFNNRMTGFTNDPRNPNRLAPGKRPIHTLNAYIATVGDALRFVGGTPGGDVQVQSNLQVLSALLDHGMSVQEAVEAPRWQHGPVGSDGRMTLQLESRYGSAVADRLSFKGHCAQVIGPWAHSSACQVIEVAPSSAFLGGSDPRCDGQAVGY